MAKPRCVFFDMGICPNGDECASDHSPKPVKKAPGKSVNVNVTQKNVRGAKQVCHFWASNKCRRGSTCQFLHAGVIGDQDISDKEARDGGRHSPIPSPTPLPSPESEPNEESPPRGQASPQPADPTPRDSEPQGSQDEPQAHNAQPTSEAEAPVEQRSSHSALDLGAVSGTPEVQVDVEEADAEDPTDSEPVLQDEGFHESTSADGPQNTEAAVEATDENAYDLDSGDFPMDSSDEQDQPYAEEHGYPPLLDMQMAGPHWSEYADPTVDLNIPFCKFFAQARCTQGNNCRFRHSLSQAEYSLLFRDPQPPLWINNAISKPSTSGGLGVCKFYPVGKCRNGDACPYVHSESPDFPPLPSEQHSESQIPPQPEPEAGLSSCRFFREQGYCHNGDQCVYGHHASGSQSFGGWPRPQQSGDQAWQGREHDASGRRPCRWFRESNCRKGANCSFLHDQPGSSSAPQDDSWNSSAQVWDASAEHQPPDTGADNDQGAGASWGDSATNDNFRKRPCKWYLQGKCQRGDNCGYLHENEKPVDDAFQSNGWEAPGGDWGTWNDSYDPWTQQPPANNDTAQKHPTEDTETTNANEVVAEEEVSAEVAIEDAATEEQSRGDEMNNEWDAPNDLEHGPLNATDKDVADYPGDAEVDEADAQTHTGPSGTIQGDEMAELEPTWAEEWPNMDPPPPKPSKIQAPCKAFGQGYCAFGDACEYLHIVEGEEASPEPPVTDDLVPALVVEPTAVVTNLPMESILFERPLFNCTVNFDPASGCSPANILSASDSCRVLLFNLPQDIEYEELRDLGDTIAPVEYIDIEYAEASARAAVEFKNPAQATHAATQLDGQTYGGRTLVARLGTVAAERTFNLGAHHSVKVTWPTPTRIAWAFYRTITIAKTEAARLDGQILDGKPIKAAFHRPRPNQTESYAVKLTGLQKDTTRESLKGFCVNNTLVNLGDPLYTTDPLESIREALAHVGNLDTFTPLPTDPSKNKQSAFARFSSPLANVMKLHRAPQLFLGGKEYLSIQQVHHATFRLSNRRLQVIRDDFEQLREAYQDACSFYLCNNDNPVIIHISSNDTNPYTFGTVNKRLQSLLHGEILEIGGEKVWDEYFELSSSVKAIEKINGDTSFFVKVDHRNKTLRVVGAALGQQRARATITRLLKLVRDQRHVIPLIDTRSLCALLHGGFEALQNEFGPNKVTLDVTVPQIVIRGDEEVLRKVQLAVGNQTSPDNPAGATDDSLCPLCGRVPTLPLGLPCKHIYCKTCLHHVARASTGPRFTPPKCIAVSARAEDEVDIQCAGYIPYAAIQGLLTMGEEGSLLRSSFLAYICDHLDEYFFCPTPNCETVYRKGRKGALYRCPGCFIEVCGWCRVESHEGLACDI